MVRKRLTITLSPKIVGRIDSLIDGKIIRSRSHAIESLLKRTLPPTISKALILAGGRGVNLTNSADKIPSALIPYENKTLLEHQIDLIKQAGIDDVVLCIGSLGEKIVDGGADNDRETG